MIEKAFICPACRAELVVSDDGWTCRRHGLYPKNGRIADFLPGSQSPFDAHWKAAESGQRPVAKKTVARHFVSPITEKSGEPLIVLDIGCGDGVHVQELLEHSDGRRIFGLDYSLGALRSALTLGEGWTPVHGDAGSLPFRENTFDAVISFGVLAYLDEPRRGVAEAVRVTTRGGMVGLWIAPPAGGLGGLLLRLTRAVVPQLPGVMQRIVADCFVPVLGLLPTASGLSLKTGTWKECREVVLVNIAPQKLTFPSADDVTNWLREAGCDIIARPHAMPGEYWARKIR